MEKGFNGLSKRRHSMASRFIKTIAISLSMMDGV